MTKVKRLNGWIIAVSVMLALVGASLAGSKSVVEIADTSPALRFYNGFGTGTNVVIVIATGGAHAAMRNLVGAVPFVFDGSGSTDTITEISSYYGSMTDAYGNAYITMDKDCSLDADSTDGELLDGTYTATPGNWAEILWDTSDVAFFSAYWPVSEFEGGVYVSRLFGAPGGTGNATISVYAAQTLLYQTGVISNTLSSTFIDLDVVVPCTAGRGVFVRAARTTATTGSIGMTLTRD